jgi:nitrate/TMAO reductase-like tetraheme cytochrome c subunit
MSPWRDVAELVSEMERERVTEFGLEQFFGMGERRQATEAERTEDARRERERKQNRESKRRSRERA